MTKAETMNRLRMLLDRVERLPEDVDVLEADVMRYNIKIQLSSGIYDVSKQYQEHVQVQHGAGDEYIRRYVRADGCDYVQLQHVAPGVL